MKTIKIIITTEDGEILDSLTLESETQFIAVRPVDYSIGKYHNEEVLNIGQ
jgi:hypothetical protein